MRIDSHAHGNVGRFDGDGVAYVESCRQRGVEGIVLIEKLDACLEAVKKFGDFIIPVAVVEMDTADAAEAEECIRSGCRGVKFIRPAAPYADLSGGTAILRSIRMWAEMFAPDGQILEGSAGKLCFGSDTGYFREGEFPFEPYIAFYEKLFDAIGLPVHVRERVNRGNIRSLFGLDVG